MVNFSLSSLLNSILFSNLLLILLYYIFKKTHLLIELGYKLLSVYLICTLLRLLFPFEVMDTIAIKMPEFLSVFIISLEIPLFYILDFGVSCWYMFLFIWIFGILIGLYKLTKSYYSFHKFISNYGTNISNLKPYHNALDEICIINNQKNCFTIIKLPAISTPMLFGIKKPYILFPETLEIKEQDIPLILIHEATHHFHKDLLLKLFSQILCVLYWWNPFVYLLNKQVSTLMELRIDSDIITTNPSLKVNYLHCLLSVAKNDTTKPSKPTISFSSSSDSILKQRFHIIMNSKTHKVKQYLFSSLIISIYLLSIFFIFEPYYISESQEGNSHELIADSSYLIENPNGEYDVYIDNQYFGTVTSIDNNFSDFIIYQSREEVDQ